MPKFSTEGKYLKNQEIDADKDTVVTITKVQQEVLENQGQKQKKWVTYFQEIDKGLGLNATNGKTICKLYGEEMNDWIGKRISLYVKDDVEFGGELVAAIRVRPRVPA